MRRFAGLLALSGALLLVLAPSSAADPLANADDIGRALLACWKPPAGSEGSFVTLSFSFRRDGTLIGRPRPTVIDVAGDGEARRRFVDAAVAAIEGCVPLEFAPGFAAGVGGQVFTIRLSGPDTRTTVRQRYASSAGSVRALSRGGMR
jgi:hypothetical protein